MKLFLLSVALLMSLTNVVVSDHAGTWAYSVNTPDGAVSGVMTLTFENDTYTGSITAYGQTYKMTDIAVNGNALQFKTSAGGYSSQIKGSFSDDSFEGIVYVEGMELPLKATRE